MDINAFPIKLEFYALHIYVLLHVGLFIYKSL